MRAVTPAGQYLRDLIEKFPDAPALTLAKKAYRERPECWASLESCRSNIRHILGVHGKKSRSETKATHHRKPRPAGWSGVIPEALTQLDDWRAVQIDTAERALILSDVHIPWHSVEALSVALDYGEKRKPTLIILNGDIADHYAISRFATDPSKRDFPEEVASVVYFLKGLRERFPKARIVYKLGNHEERWQAYMRMKCAELLGLKAFDWDEIFELAKYKVELVEQKRPIRLGKLNVIHGHEYRFAIAGPVNPARGFYMKAKTHVLGGHLHHTSQHSEKNLEGKVVSAWSTGCLCDVHPEYAPLNNWSQGFAFVTTDDEGDFQVDNLRIIDGKVY
jgi:predicted phosphodiesterase